MNSSKILFYRTIILGILITIRSNNWIIIWCGLEISLVSFIPLIVSKLSIASESTIKYFIVQRIRSSILMLRILVIIIKGDYSYNYVLTAAVIIKTGVAPFHNWVLTVIEGLDLFIVIIILTINKIAPLTLLRYIARRMIIIMCLTILLGRVMGLNQNSVKKLIGYSSIFNIGLILAVVKFNFIWMMYLLVYSIMLLIIYTLLKRRKINFINQIVFRGIISKKISLWINILSIGGIPPLIGFSIKYMVIIYIIKIKLTVTVIIIVMASILVIFFYLRMIFLSIIRNSLVSKIKLFNLNEISSWTTIINIFSLPIVLITKTYLV